MIDLPEKSEIVRSWTAMGRSCGVPLSGLTGNHGTEIWITAKRLQEWAGVRACAILHSRLDTPSIDCRRARMSFRPLGASSTLRAASRFRTSFARCKLNPIAENEIYANASSCATVCVKADRRAKQKSARHCCSYWIRSRSDICGRQKMECLSGGGEK